uniref:adenylate cyclase n=1 Tax=Trypanosoma evansi TaxID=5697 RepID=G1CRQ1_TRYEV|nr:adenylate cyclase [Trypanosoma evansi]
MASVGQSAGFGGFAGVITGRHITTYSTGGTMRRRPPAITFFLIPLLLVLPHIVRPLAAKKSIKVKVYNLLFTNRAPRRSIETMGVGLNASFAARHWATAENVTVEIIPPPPRSVSTLKLLETAADQNKGEFFVVVGPMGDTRTLAVLPLLRQEDLVAFAPLTGSSAVRGWDPHFYFLTPAPNAELIALLRYAINRLRLLRVGFMYLQGVHFGDREYQETLKLMTRMGRRLCGVFTKMHAATVMRADEEFDSLWEEFVMTHPQGVIVFTPPIREALKFVRRVAMDARTRGVYVLAPSAMQFVIGATWRTAVEEAAVPYIPDRVIVAAPNPLASETKYHAVRRFQEDARSYLRYHPGVTAFNASDDFDHDDADGALMVSGWVIGEVLSQALSSRTWLESREAFVKSLYNQRRYVVDDLVFGNFGGECHGMAGERGASCLCNQGGNVVYMNSLGDDHRMIPLRDGITVFNIDRCSTIGVKVPTPLIVVVVLVVDDSAAVSAFFSLVVGITNADAIRSITNPDRVAFHSVVATSRNTYGRMQGELDTRSVTAVFGVVDLAMLSVGRVAFIEPITLSPKLSHPGRNVIHFSPTIEQQLFLLVGYIARDKKTTSLHMVTRGGDVPGIGSVFQKTIESLGGSMNGIVVPDNDTTLNEDLSPHGDTLVFGLTEADITTVAEHLDNHRGVRVFVSFFDVALLYSEFVKVFKKHPQAAERLLFATSLPHWADNNTTSETVKRFHEEMKDDESKWTPLALLGYATARAMESVVSRMGRVNSEELINGIFSQSVIVADDMWYGPFEDSCVPTTGFAAEGCAVNYGATHISVWSMARVLNPSVPPVTKAATPSMRYANRNRGSLSGKQLAGVIVGALSALVLFFVLLLVCTCLLGKGARDNENAPKEMVIPVTLIFTDIESSTAQWAAHPELMPDAVATHHRLIRTLISKYGCYEVKTVGDSFMIACKSPFAAAQLACDLQRCFLEHDWKTDVFDTSYREFERQHAEDDGDYVPPTGHLDPDVYSRLWNGLRVRVGIHTGLCDIRHDEVTKGYDYYGRTSNMAARTESIANGGQVLLSRSAYHALSTSEREQLNVTALGDVPLRGVPKPVKMYQLNAVPGRTFAALRLDNEAADDDGSSASFSDAGSVCGPLTGSSLMIASSLQAIFGTVCAAQREKLLNPVCERWRVSVPRKGNNGWEGVEFEDVIRRLSVKVGRVVDHCVSNSGEHSESTLRSASLIIISRHGGENSTNEA